MSRIDVKLAECQQLAPEEIQILSKDVRSLRVTDEQIGVVTVDFA